MKEALELQIPSFVHGYATAESIMNICENYDKPVSSQVLLNCMGWNWTAWNAIKVEDIFYEVLVFDFENSYCVNIVGFASGRSYHI